MFISFLRLWWHAYVYGHATRIYRGLKGRYVVLFCACCREIMWSNLPKLPKGPVQSEK